MIASSSRSRSWLTTSSAPRYDAQESEQPLLRVGVEVVGRLVEQEQLAARRTGCGRARRGGARHRRARSAGGRAGRGAGRARRRGGGPPTRPRSRPRRGTTPRRAANRATLRSDGSSSTRDAQLLELARGGVEAAAGQDVGEPGGVDARATRPRVLGQVAEASGRRTTPPAASASPASTFSRLVLPAPLRPTRPTLSPARSENDASAKVRRPPTSTDSERAWSTLHGPTRARPGRNRFRALEAAPRHVESDGQGANPPRSRLPP